MLRIKLSLTKLVSRVMSSRPPSLQHEWWKASLSELSHGLLDDTVDVSTTQEPFYNTLNEFQDPCKESETLSNEERNVMATDSMTEEIG